MKKILLFTMCAIAAFTFSSCRSSKNEKSPIKTYVMPCSEHVSSDGVLRAWASGSSDNETAARKKALASASAELAAILTKTVNSTTEDYTSSLNEGVNGMSKSFLSEKNKITVEKTLSGATIVCDRWNKDENGQYTNYIVLELKGKEYLKALYEELSKESNSEINKELLEELFIKNINSSNND